MLKIGSVYSSTEYPGTFLILAYIESFYFDRYYCICTSVGIYWASDDIVTIDSTSRVAATLKLDERYE